MDADLKAHSDEPYNMGIETTTGGFFNRQSRDTGRFEWQETYTARPIDMWGHHEAKVGLDLVRNNFDGWNSFRPVDVLRESGQPAEQIAYTPSVKRPLSNGNTPALLWTNGPFVRESPWTPACV